MRCYCTHKQRVKLSPQRSLQRVPLDLGNLIFACLLADYHTGALNISILGSQRRPPTVNYWPWKALRVAFGHRRVRTELGKISCVPALSLWRGGEGVRIKECTQSVGLLSVSLCRIRARMHLLWRKVHGNAYLERSCGSGRLRVDFGRSTIDSSGLVLAV